MFQPSINKLPQQILNSGNIVTVGLQLYLWRFWLYFSMSLRAILWLIIPFYGWAKFFLYLAIISRIAFLDFINQPEEISDSRDKTSKKIWSILITNVLIFITMLLFSTIVLISESLLIALIVNSINDLYFRNNLFLYGIISLGIILTTFSTFIVGVNWLYSRLILIELPLVLETDISVFGSIKNSWNLTRGFLYACKAQAVFIIFALVFVPILSIFQIGSSLIEVIFDYSGEVKTSSFSLIFILSELFIYILLFSLFIPFLQTIKAVLYYEAQSCREGFGLELSSEKIETENYLPAKSPFKYLRLQTPESVELEFYLAGIGNRSWALFIDYVIIFSIWFAFWIGFIFIGMGFIDFLDRITGSFPIRQWVWAIFLLVSFGFYTGYFAFFETLWQGQTPGKRLAQIRVIRDDGRPVGLQQTILRSLVKPFDYIIFLGAFAITFTSSEKRLGDWVGGTVVIQSPKTNSSEKIEISEQAIFLAETLYQTANISAVLPDDFATIGKYLRIRKHMSNKARGKLNSRLAKQIQGAIGLEEFPDVSVDVFLEAFYTAYQKTYSFE